MTCPSPSITRSGRSVIARSFFGFGRPVKCWEYTAPPEGRSRQREQPGARLADGPRAVADAILFLRGQLGQAPAERRIEEEGVVAEAALPPCRVEEQALDHALECLLAPPLRIDDRDERAEPGRAALPRHAGHFPQHDLASLGIAE